jgi:LPS-assembly protein
MGIKKAIYILCTPLLILGAYSALAEHILPAKEDELALTCAPSSYPIDKINTNSNARRLGWVSNDSNRCGGYYLEAPFTYPQDFVLHKLIEITSTGPVIFAPHGNSQMQGNIKITQLGQQVTANKAFLYRDAKTSKLEAIDLYGDVNLREPDSLVIANKAHLDLINKTQSLNNIIYRTAIYSPSATKPGRLTNDALQKVRTVTQLSAWGKAKQFIKNKEKVYEFKQASYSTCPPDNNVWKVKAQHLTLNKNTGRGVATHARLYIRSVPIFYTPYFNFPIDERRQTGFLFPTFGSSNTGGPYIGAPFYWNMAPNYDSLITPVVWEKRGLQISETFRYLTKRSDGQVNVSVTPSDKAFASLQSQMTKKFNTPISTSYQLADLKRLENASQMRSSISWQHHDRFNEHWSSNIDYNFVSDDYYMRDYRSSLNEITQNQLLQQAAINYKQKHWNFMAKVQQYQTLHPVDDLSPTLEQYSRFPQLTLEGDYPNQQLGLNYFISNDLTHFDVRNTPGIDGKLPMGNRLHIQPGLSLPINLPYFFITPRLQLALTQYEIGHVSLDDNKDLTRVIPIVDINSGLFFDRNITLFGNELRQTLEPQLYYTYIPYRNQDALPIFDTTLNTLTYEQLFSFNRFSGLDRFGDANQIGVGVSTRFLDANNGNEKIRFGIGEIIYLHNRRVNLCSIGTPNCPDASTLSNNKVHRSPISAVMNYALNQQWSLIGNTIWNTHDNAFDNQSFTIAYAPDDKRNISAGYNFVRHGDLILPNAPTNSTINNLKQANIAFAWPVMPNWSAVGRVTKSINRNYFQNVIYGLQYDSCCWAIRFVAGKTFVRLDPSDNITPVYDKQFFVQFALRGLGNLGTGDPSQYISSNTGHTAEFGQDF